MLKIRSIFLILFLPLLFGTSVHAETIFTNKWSTNNEFPFYYTSTITSGDHGLIIEGNQTGVAAGKPVNYALVVDRFWTDQLISYEKIYGNTTFKIMLKAPKGSKCKIRIFVYGGGEYPKGTIKVSRY
jgi:hypothetical protein